MKKIFAVTAALAILGNSVKVSAMPMPDEMNEETRYIHEIMVGCNDDTLRASDGNEFRLENVDTIHPIQYEVCMDTYCTETRLDDEIVDFCPLVEVLEVHSAYVLQGGAEIVITDDCAEGGYVYALDEQMPEFSHVYVIMNTHWSEDATKHTIYGITDMETYECYQMEQGVSSYAKG